MINEPIAKPVGLFKAGKSGAGGQYEQMTRIRRDIFQLTNMIFGLQPLGGYKNIDPMSMIIDIEQDGYKMEDPHSSRPMSFVTDYPAQDRGTWFGTFKAPNAGEQYSALGKHHKTKISVAPRQPPTTTMNMTIVVPKDGATKTVTTTSRTITPSSKWVDCHLITTYTEEVTVSTIDVPLEIEITYEGYSVTQVLGPRDFSPEAGGASAEFEFEIFSSSMPPYDLPVE